MLIHDLRGRRRTIMKKTVQFVFLLGAITAFIVGHAQADWTISLKSTPAQLSPGQHSLIRVTVTQRSAQDGTGRVRLTVTGPGSIPNYLVNFPLYSFDSTEFRNVELI